MRSFILMEANIKLRSPSTIIVSGSSGVGKTKLTEDMICMSEQVFEKRFEEVHWVYAKFADDQKLFSRLKETLGKQNVPITFHEGYPEELITSLKMFSTSKEVHKVIVIDDLFVQPTPCNSLTNLFSVISNHQQITVIVLIQNLHASTPAQRSCLGSMLRSTAYLIAFVNRRMLPIVKSTATNFFGDEKFRLLEPFNYLLSTSEQHNYILIDFLNDDVRLQVRERGVLPTEKCHIFIFPVDTTIHDV